MRLLAKLGTKNKNEALTVLAVVLFVLAVAIAYGKLITLAVEAINTEYTIQQDDGP